MERLKWIFFLGLIIGGLFKLLHYSGGDIILLVTALIGSIYCISKIIKG